MKRKIKVVLLIALMLICTEGALTGCGSGSDNEVRVYSYGDYFDEDIIDAFEEETGITVVLDTYDTAEEMYPIIKNQAGVYDVICTSDYMIERMGNEGLLQELDYDQIPEAVNTSKEYLEIADKYYDPGNKLSVPYQVGVAGIMYDKSKIPEGSITSWKDLWDEKYSGRIIMQDSLRDTLMVALKAQGYSLNTMNESELQSAVDMLIQQKPLIYKYANDSARDFLIGESADIGVVWNGEMLYSQELNENMAFVIPEEGTELFIDAWVVPANAKNYDNAMAWINYLCRADVAYTNFEYLTYCTPNEAAKAMLDEEIQNNEQLFLPQEMLDKSEVLRDLGAEGDELYSKYWKQFKSV